MCPLSSGWGQV